MYVATYPLGEQGPKSKRIPTGKSKENLDDRIQIPKLEISSHRPQRTLSSPGGTTDDCVGSSQPRLTTDINGGHLLPDDKIVVHFRGTAGDGFGNGLCSGVTFVVDGIGKNGCQKMTGGRIVLLSAPGADFASEMRGGTIYLPASAGLKDRTLALQPEDVQTLHDLLDEHLKLTQSEVAAKFLTSWPESAKEFVKIVGK